jgi:serine protease
VVAPPTVAISASTSSPTAGLSVTLTASQVTANGGRSISAYQWTVASGSAFATLSGPTSASTATLLTSAAGTVVVTLTVTDSGGASGNASTTVNVQAAPVVTASTPATSTPSGGGGGGMSVGWVALLGLAAGLLRRTHRTRATSLTG